MSRFSSFFFGVVTGAAGLFLSMQFYLVRANDGFHFVPKMAAKLENPYVDIRNFTMADWQKQQALAVAIVKANRTNLMQDSTFASVKQAAERTLEQWTGSK